MNNDNIRYLDGERSPKVGETYLIRRKDGRCVSPDWVMVEHDAKGRVVRYMDSECEDWIGRDQLIIEKVR